MNDIDGIRILRSLRKITQQPQSNTMIFGEIVSVEPLKIDIGDNVILTKNFLYLGQMCRPHRVTIPHNHLINALESETTKAINTTKIEKGVPVNVKQKTGTYDVKTQEITRNDEKGIDERELKVETKQEVDLGGATLSMSIDVKGSPVSTSGGAGTVTSTTDLSTFGVNDSGHEHIIPEHSTQDVHFPKTDYEESVTIEIYPRLKVGDKVLLFAMNNNQMYYVAERIEV